jgi:hypothetical protein
LTLVSAAKEDLLSPSEPFNRLKVVVVVELEDEELEGLEDAPVPRNLLPLSSQVKLKVQLPLKRRIVVYALTVANLTIVRPSVDSHDKPTTKRLMQLILNMPTL